MEPSPSTVAVPEARSRYPHVSVFRRHGHPTRRCESIPRRYALSRNSQSLRVQVDRDVLAGLAGQRKLLLKRMGLIEDQVDVGDEAVRVDRTAPGSPQRRPSSVPLSTFRRRIHRALLETVPTLVLRPTFNNPPALMLSAPVPQ